MPRGVRVPQEALKFILEYKSKFPESMPLACQKDLKKERSVEVSEAFVLKQWQKAGLVPRKRYKKRLNELGVGDEGRHTSCTVEARDNPFERQVYCALQERFDIGVSVCPYRCAYCYVQSSSSALKRRKPAVKAMSAAKRAVRSAREGSGVLTIGICNEPTLPMFRDILAKLVRFVRTAKIWLVVQTKNPEGLVEIIESAKLPPHQLCAKVSLGCCDTELAAKIEPGAPLVPYRVAGARQLAMYGVDVVLRLQPLMLGYYEGIERVMADMPFVERVIVEPVRVSRAGIKYFSRMEPFLHKHGQSWDRYFDEWGYTDDRRFIGNQHWYEYDPLKLRTEYMMLRDMAHRYGKKFGICSGMYGWQNVDLNDGRFCCESRLLDGQRVRFDRMSLTALAASGELGRLAVPALRGMDSTHEDWELMLCRVGWANDARFPRLVRKE